ncbi:MAG: RluA family pseudouridine synthase [Oscillospiraceae bacterium]|nr:RluA family pseudouridine synthase [Oscillospiraceae bacterium]
MREIIVGKNDAAVRLDKFLNKSLPKMPLSLLQKSIRKGRVRINGKKITDCRHIISLGDTLSLYINDEFFEKEPSKMDFLLSKNALDIIYEDENILLLNKGAGIAVHDFEGGGVDTLINRVLRYLYEKKEYDAENENSFVPALCNRIDRNTCGIVIAAKNAMALRVMNEQIKEHKVIKKYLCLCHGTPKPPEAELTLYLKKLEDKKISLVSDKRLPDYKTATTYYKTLETKGGISLLEVTLKTGRTHQIRASLAHIGCPLVGDGKYGRQSGEDSRLGFPYQALCSYYVGFDFKDAGELSYLDGKSFTVSDIWFKEKFK